MKKDSYLEKLYNSKKSLIIYKVRNGYDLFTDFSERIILHNKNIDIFLNKLENLKNLDLQINFVACISDFLDINCYVI